MTSVREQVVAAIVAGLKGIDGSAPYSNDIKNRVYDLPENPGNLYQLPFIQVIEGRELYQEGPTVTPTAALTRYLGVLVQLWIEGEHHTAPAMIRSLLADVERALLADTTWGDLAIRTDLISNEPVLARERLPRTGVMLEIEVHYRTHFDDPDANI